MAPPEYFRRDRDDMRGFLPDRPRRVLEIGCGEGNFIAAIPGECEKWGIEPGETAAHAAATRLDRVLTGRFDAVSDQLPKAYFDLVICNDVIEHMEDHDGFLRAIRDYIHEGGVLVGCVPNMRNYKVLYELLVLKDWQYRDSGILDRTHLRFFTEQSLRRGLTGAGFRIDALRGMNGSLSPGRAKHAWPRFLLACAAIGLTLGGARDIRHVQFGFRATAM